MVFCYYSMVKMKISETENYTRRVLPIHFKLTKGSGGLLYQIIIFSYDFLAIVIY